MWDGDYDATRHHNARRAIATHVHDSLLSSLSDFNQTYPLLFNLLARVQQMCVELVQRRRSPRRGAHFTREGLARTANLYQTLEIRGRQLQSECVQLIQEYAANPSITSVPSILSTVELHHEWYNFTQAMVQKFDQSTFLHQ